MTCLLLGSAVFFLHTVGFFAVVGLEKEIAGEIVEMRRVRGEIVRAIEAVEDADQRTVLEMRYLAGWRFDAIAREMHYDRTWILEIHKRGVGGGGTDYRHKSTPGCDMIYSWRVGR